MRRRLHSRAGHRAADELADVLVRAEATAARSGLSVQEQNRIIRDELAQAGTGLVECYQALHAVRRGARGGGS